MPAAVALFATICTVGFPTVIVTPLTPSQEESAAAHELSRIWTIGTGLPARIQNESAPMSDTEPEIFIGETTLANRAASLPSTLDEDGFRVVCLGDRRAILRSVRRDGILLATYWFAQHLLGARWYIPGSDGEIIRPFKTWQPATLDILVEPGFKSRILTGLGAGGSTWALRNGLRERWQHGHALYHLFPPKLFDQQPELFPLIGGHRYRPADEHDYNWQPNLAVSTTVDYTIGLVRSFFGSEPAAESYSLCINDSDHFDQSIATLAARGPLRWFRNQPDYSDVVFGFMNRVAKAIGRDYPKQVLSAYAYQWCEDAPSFRIEPDVLPWLTSDRTDWYDPSCAREDQALIRRWCHSGARVVGCYDYLYGNPFIVPRVTTRLTAQSISFEYEAGVRAYTAEANAQWAFDGPKLWLVSQLLWDPHQPIKQLLNDYYQDFWAESASPMRDFYERCERIWMRQPRPGWWIKYYDDEDQSVLFPVAACRELRDCLNRAKTLAQSETIRRRVEAVSTAFRVTESFVRFCDARNRMSIAAHGPKAAPNHLLSELGDYLDARLDFSIAYGQAVGSGASSNSGFAVYLRDDPTSRTIEMASRNSRQSWGDSAPLRDGRWNGLLQPLGESIEAKWANAEFADATWQGLSAPGPLNDTTFIWSSVPWLAKGLPCEGRKIQLRRGSAGNVSIDFKQCLSESVSQWADAIPDAFYRARVEFTGRVGIGDQEFIILNWEDAQGSYVGEAVADRIPVGNWRNGFQLEVAARAPLRAAKVGVGIYVAHQLASDEAAYSGLSIQRTSSTSPSGQR